ncbi:hypothetical protein [Nitrosophilus kaiyonis]|nr:hypothetical protein [Nitrosophilus kaiyonis]
MLGYNQIVFNPFLSNIDLLIKIFQSKAAFHWNRERILQVQRKRFVKSF